MVRRRTRRTKNSSAKSIARSFNDFNISNNTKWVEKLTERKKWTKITNINRNWVNKAKDVTIDGLWNGKVLAWDSVLMKWKPVTIGVWWPDEYVNWMSLVWTILTLSRAIGSNLTQDLSSIAWTNTDERVKWDATDPTTGYLNTKIQKSIVYNSASFKIELDWDTLAPWNDMFYGTNATGVKGWRTLPWAAAVYYQTVEDEWIGLTQRTITNFVGDGVTVTDTGGKTTVTIPWGAAADELVKASATDTAGYLDAKVKNSVEVDSDDLQWVWDALAPWNNFYYGTNATGVKGWYATTATDELVKWDVTDPTTGYLNAKIEDSIVYDAVNFMIHLDWDIFAPWNSMYYGTNSTWVKGRYNSSTNSAYVHTQWTGATTWNINHNLNSEDFV